LPGYSTSDVAKRAGVHRDTLLRWLREGAVPEPRRDRRGWRVFSEGEAAFIEGFAQDSIAVTRAPEVVRLENIDWDFRDAKTSYLTHGIHPYPAKFIPQIPNALIQGLSSVGDTVADIFCGSGTTLVEALLLKRHAIGLDANPLACLITKAKTSQLSAKTCALINELADRADHYAEYASNRERPLFPEDRFVSAAPRPNSDALDFWFEQVGSEIEVVRGSELVGQGTLDFSRGC